MRGLGDTCENLGQRCDILGQHGTFGARRGTGKIARITNGLTDRMRAQDQPRDWQLRWLQRVNPSLEGGQGLPPPNCGGAAMLLDTSENLGAVTHLNGRGKFRRKGCLQRHCQTIVEMSRCAGIGLASHFEPQEGAPRQLSFLVEA